MGSARVGSNPTLVTITKNIIHLWDDIILVMMSYFFFSCFLTHASVALFFFLPSHSRLTTKVLPSEVSQIRGFWRFWQAQGPDFWRPRSQTMGLLS